MKLLMRGNARSTSVMTSAGSMRAGSVVSNPPAYTQASKQSVPMLVNGVSFGQDGRPGVPGWPDCRTLTEILEASCQDASRLPVRCNHHCVSGQRLSCAQQSVLHRCAGAVPLDDRRQSRAQPFWLATLIFCSSLQGSQKPPIWRAPTKVVKATRLAAIGKARLKVVFTSSDARNAAHPGRQA